MRVPSQLDVTLVLAFSAMHLTAMLCACSTDQMFESNNVHVAVIHRSCFVGGTDWSLKYISGEVEQRDHLRVYAQADLLQKAFTLPANRWSGYAQSLAITCDSTSTSLCFAPSSLLSCKGIGVLYSICPVGTLLNYLHN